MIFRLISTVSIILVMSTNWTVSAKEEFSVDRELSYCRSQVKKALKELRPHNKFIIIFKERNYEPKSLSYIGIL